MLVPWRTAPGSKISEHSSATERPVQWVVTLVGRAGPGPSWCRYQDGPWTVPHDTLVDLEAAAAWILAFNARWQVALIVHGMSDSSVLDLVRDHQEDYLSLFWL